MSILLLYLTGTLLRGAVLALPAWLWGRYGRLRSWMFIALLAIALLPVGVGSWRLPAMRRPVPMAAMANAPAQPAAETPAPEVTLPILPLELRHVREVKDSVIAIGWAGWVGVLYIGLTLLWCVWRGCRVWTWTREVRGCPPVTDERMLRLFADARQVTGVTWEVDFRNSGVGGAGPACFGWRHARVLFPELSERHLSEAQLRMLMVHELEHIRRGDHRSSWLIFILEGIFWFNPGIRYLAGGWKLAREVECDEAVGRDLRLSRPERMTYAGLLLELSAATPFGNVPAPGASRSARQLKQRMTELIMNTKNRIWGSVAVVVLVTVLGLWVPMGCVQMDAVRELDDKVAAFQPPELETGDWIGYGQRISALCKEGKYEEALVNARWYWDHVLEYDSAFYGVRLSFFISEWKELAQLYPPAREELIRTRDRGEAHLRAGNLRLHYDSIMPDGSVRDWEKQPPLNKMEEGRQWLDSFGDTAVLQDVFALNEALEDMDATIALAQYLDQAKPAFLAATFNRLYSRLCEDERAAPLFAKYMTDMEGEWQQHLDRYQESIGEDYLRKLKLGDEGEKQYIASMKELCLQRCADYIRMARWSGREDMIPQMEQEVIEVFGEPVQLQAK